MWIWLLSQKRTDHPAD